MAGNARGEQRRSVILQAAVGVVARGGVGALTHRATAGAAEVSLASVTYHFPGIGDLRRATLARAAEVVGREFAGSLDCGADRDAAVAALVDRWRQVGLAHRVEFRALFALLAEALHDPELHGQVDALLAAPTAMLVERGCPDDLAEGVVGALVGLALINLARSPGDAGDGAPAAVRRFERSVIALFGGLASAAR